MADRDAERKTLRQTMARRRAEAARKPAPAPRPGPTTDQIARIDTLTRDARTTWFGLMTYLAFIGVTLLGVEDADFFLTERQTDLPLIGVSVPTALFFAIAPALGAMLYAYLHLYLLKLWEALAETPLPTRGAPLGDLVTPWLVADFALSFRKGTKALRPRPMRRLAFGVSLILIFLATPLVLAAFWWRSMPKHDEALTVLACGIPLLIALYTGLAS